MTTADRFSASLFENELVTPDVTKNFHAFIDNAQIAHGQAELGEFEDAALYQREAIFHFRQAIKRARLDLLDETAMTDALIDQHFTLVDYLLSNPSTPISQVDAQIDAINRTRPVTIAKYVEIPRQTMIKLRTLSQDSNRPDEHQAWAFTTTELMGKMHQERADKIADLERRDKLAERYPNGVVRAYPRLHNARQRLRRVSAGSKKRRGNDG